MAKSIEGYRMINRLLRGAVWVLFFALILPWYEWHGENVWLIPVLIVILVAGNLIWKGGFAHFDKGRIFILPSGFLDQIRESVLERGYRQIDKDGNHYVKRSNYLVVFIVSIEQIGDRLIMEAPKKLAEEIYAIGTGQLSTSQQ